MVDADEETALLSSARDAAGRVEPPRRRVRVVAFVLVLVGALALVAAAGCGCGAADSETHKVAHLQDEAGLLAVGVTGSVTLGTYGADLREADGEGGEPHQISPLNGPPAPNYYHKGPRGPRYNLNSANSCSCPRYVNVESFESFFAKILSRPTRVLEMAIDLAKGKGSDGTQTAALKDENEINGQWYIK